MKQPSKQRFGNRNAAKPQAMRRIQKQFSVRPETVERLSRLSQKTGKNNSELVAMALKNFEESLAEK